MVFLECGKKVRDNNGKVQSTDFTAPRSVWKDMATGATGGGGVGVGTEFRRVFIAGIPTNSNKEVVAHPDVFPIFNCDNVLL